MQEATNNATGNTTDWAGWGTAGSAVGAYFDGVLSGIAQHGELGLESASRIIGRMSAMIDVGVFAGPALARAAVDGRFNEEFIAQGTSFVGSVAGMRIGLRSGAWLGAKLGSRHLWSRSSTCSFCYRWICRCSGGEFRWR